ncbi:MAG: hypothetical protein AB3N33_04560 [Puniceicoccaceae bacterium]
MTRYRSLLLLVAGLVPLWSVAQIEVIVGEYTQFNKQTGPDTLVGFGDHTNFEFGGNYSSYLSVEGQDTLSSLTVTGPSYPTPTDIPFDEDLWEIFGSYATAEEMTTAFMPGTYTIAGIGAISDTWNELLVMGAYNPLTPLKVTNFEALQSFNHNQPLTIEWTEFTEGQGAGPNLGYAGVINIEIYGFNEFGGYPVYDSENDTQEGAFGLLPTETSITLPVGTFNATDYYVVNIFFARVDTAREATTLQDALIATVTGYEVELNIYQEGNAPFEPTDWAGYPIVDSPPSKYIDTSPWLGWMIIDDAPWLYNLSLDKYIYVQEGWVSPSGSWVYIPNF